MTKVGGVWKLARGFQVAVLAMAMVVMNGAAVSAEGLLQTTGFTVTPAAGYQDQTFVVEGAGFAPNSVLEESYVSPEGERFSYVIDGVPAVVQVDGGGQFVVSVLPMRDFAGAREGLWQVWFCAPGGDPCWVAEITIAA